MIKLKDILNEVPLGTYTTIGANVGDIFVM